LKSSFIQDNPTEIGQPQRSCRPTSGPATPTMYQVKRGGKIYKVVVGYVSPFTSPLERNDLHLQTEGEIDAVVTKIKQQQDQQRKLRLKSAPQSTLK
jgi:hypothetical protein